MSMKRFLRLTVFSALSLNLTIGSTPSWGMFSHLQKKSVKPKETAPRQWNASDIERLSRDIVFNIRVVASKIPVTEAQIMSLFGTQPSLVAPVTSLLTQSQFKGLAPTLAKLIKDEDDFAKLLEASQPVVDDFFNQVYDTESKRAKIIEDWQHMPPEGSTLCKTCIIEGYFIDHARNCLIAKKYDEMAQTLQLLLAFHNMYLESDSFKTGRSLRDCQRYVTNSVIAPSLLFSLAADWIQGQKTSVCTQQINQHAELFAKKVSRVHAITQKDFDAMLKFYSGKGRANATKESNTAIAYFEKNFHPVFDLFKNFFSGENFDPTNFLNQFDWLPWLTLNRRSVLALPANILVLDKNGDSQDRITKVDTRLPRVENEYWEKRENEFFEPNSFIEAKDLASIVDVDSLELGDYVGIFPNPHGESIIVQFTLGEADDRPAHKDKPSEEEEEEEASSSITKVSFGVPKPVPNKSLSSFWTIPHLTISEPTSSSATSPVDLRLSENQVLFTSSEKALVRQQFLEQLGNNFIKTSPVGNFLSFALEHASMNDLVPQVSSSSNNEIQPSENQSPGTYSALKNLSLTGANKLVSILPEHKETERRDQETETSNDSNKPLTIDLGSKVEFEHQPEAKNPSQVGSSSAKTRSRWKTTSKKRLKATKSDKFASSTSHISKNDNANSTDSED